MASFAGAFYDLSFMPNSQQSDMTAFLHDSSEPECSRAQNSYSSDVASSDSDISSMRPPSRDAFWPKSRETSPARDAYNTRGKRRADSPPLLAPETKKQSRRQAAGDVFNPMGACDDVRSCQAGPSKRPQRAEPDDNGLSALVAAMDMSKASTSIFASESGPKAWVRWQKATSLCQERVDVGPWNTSFRSDSIGDTLPMSSRLMMPSRRKKWFIAESDMLTLVAKHLAVPTDALMPEALDLWRQVARDEHRALGIVSPMTLDGAYQAWMLRCEPSKPCVRAPQPPSFFVVTLDEVAPLLLKGAQLFRDCGVGFVPEGALGPPVMPL